VCEQLRIPCPVLKKYCTNRDRFFIQNELTKETGKELMISILYGGSKEYNKIEDPTPDLRKFHSEEMPKIHERLAAYHLTLYELYKEKRIAKGETYNHQGSFTCQILCDIENKILNEMFDFFGSSKNCVLCFDGLMIKSSVAVDLKACEQKIFDKLHINTKLAVKPFECAFDMSAYKIPVYKEMSLSHYYDFKNLVGKEVDLDVAVEWLNNSVVLIENGGAAFFLTKCKTIDNVTKTERVTYKPIKKDVLFDNLDAKCLIRNNKYDYDYCVANKKVKNKEGLDQEKLKPYLFETLRVKMGFLQNYFEERKLKSCDFVDFVPFLERNGEPYVGDSFNMFTGFPFERVTLTKEIDFEKSHIYKHIRDELMNGNVDEFNHFLDHLADMIQDPANIKSTGHVFYSAEGCGKGLLAEFVSKLIGADHFISFENTEAYFGQFNADQANKILRFSRN